MRILTIANFNDSDKIAKTGLKAVLQTLANDLYSEQVTTDTDMTIITDVQTYASFNPSNAMLDANLAFKVVKGTLYVYMAITNVSPQSSAGIGTENNIVATFNHVTGNMHDFVELVKKTELAVGLPELSPNIIYAILPMNGYVFTKGNASWVAAFAIGYMANRFTNLMLNLQPVTQQTGDKPGVALSCCGEFKLA